MHIYRPHQPAVCLLPRNDAPSPGSSDSHTDLAQTTRSAPESTPPTADETLNRLATAAVGRQQYSQALQLLTTLIDRQPENAAHYSNRGLVHLRLGQVWAALVDCDQAVDLAPDLDQAYNNRALCHSSLGDWAAALDDYERAIDLNPFNSRARINLGVTLRQIGDFERAIDCLEEALMFRHLPEFIYAELGRTYHLRGDWNCALANYRRSLEAAAPDGIAPDLAETERPTAQIQTLVDRVKGWVHDLVPQAV
jgi:tetratricopeptide (TPR) repeat protein